MKLRLPLISALALAVVALDTAAPALAQQMGQMGSPAQCNRFVPLNTQTQAKANAVQAAMKAKADRKDLCRLMTAFVASEGSVVKFLIENQTWCGVPPQAVVAAKASHEKSLKFRDTVCTEAPGPKAPTLSDAIKTAPVDSVANTKTGPGSTFDTLTGNPLGR
jgi:hypothetical protein